MLFSESGQILIVLTQFTTEIRNTSYSYRVFYFFCIEMHAIRSGIMTDLGCPDNETSALTITT